MVKYAVILSLLSLPLWGSGKESVEKDIRRNISQRHTKTDVMLTPSTSRPSSELLSTVPGEINYQGFLTTSLDTTPLDTVLQMTFGIYSAEVGGTPIWSETHNSVQVTKGVFNVLLGSINPIPASVFDGDPRWLQVEVGGEVLSPRKEIVSVPYSFRSGYADSAGYATGGSVSYADSAGHLVGPDSIIVSASGVGALYLENAAGYGLRLRSSNDGIRIDSTGGDGLHVKHANWSGALVDTAYIGFSVDTASGYGLFVGGARYDGLYVGYVGDDGVTIGDARDNGVYVYNADTNGVYVYNAGDDGVQVDKAGRYGLLITHANSSGVHVDTAFNGFLVDTASNYGLFVGDVGNNGVYVGNAENDGVYVSYAGIYGVEVWSAGFAGINAYGGVNGGVFYNNATHPTLYVDNWHGATISDTLAQLCGNDTLRFYFLGDGNAYAEGNWNTFRKNSKGEYESFSSIQAARQEIVAHGTGKLENGTAHISFNSSFSEFVTDKEPIEITVTPVGSYSGLYIAERSSEGFTVKSGAGDPNCEFTWIAIGVERGKEERLTVGNIDETGRSAMEMARKREARHSKMMRERELRETRKAHYDNLKKLNPERPIERPVSQKLIEEKGSLRR